MPYGRTEGPPSDPYLRKLWFKAEQARAVKPEGDVIRPCGCVADPVVWGHFHPNGCQGKPVTR